MRTPISLVLLWRSPNLSQELFTALCQSSLPCFTPCAGRRQMYDPERMYRLCITRRLRCEKSAEIAEKWKKYGLERANTLMWLAICRRRYPGATDRVLFRIFFCILGALTSRRCMYIQCISPRQGERTNIERRLVEANPLLHTPTDTQTGERTPFDSLLAFDSLFRKAFCF